MNEVNFNDKPIAQSKSQRVRTRRSIELDECLRRLFDTLVIDDVVEQSVICNVLSLIGLVEERLVRETREKFESEELTYTATKALQKRIEERVAL